MKEDIINEFLLEFCGWLFVIFLTCSIWVDELRWKLFFTSFIFLFLCFVFFAAVHSKETGESEE